MEPDRKLDQLASRTIGAAIEVHRHLGPGYLEQVYEEALTIELRTREIPHRRQVEFGVNYKGNSVGKNRLDFLIGERLIVELKSVATLNSVHKAQVISYLKSTTLQLGLLINFNVAVLNRGIQRVVLTH
ncbi:MAG: GxxExxY protein [Pseudomonadota bacterium]